MLFGPTLAAMCTSVRCFQKEFSKRMQALQRSLFDSGELAVTSLSHSRASSPRKGLWGSVNLLSYSADVFHISHGSTSTFVALPSFVTISLDSMSAGLL